MKFYVLSMGVLAASLMTGTAQAAPVHFSGDDGHGNKFVPPFFDDTWKPSDDKGKSHGDDGDGNHGNLGNFLADLDGDDHHHHHKHHDDFRFVGDPDGHHDYNCDPGGPSPTPLPGSLTLFATGLMALGAFGFSRRMRRRAS